MKPKKAKEISTKEELIETTETEKKTDQNYGKFTGNLTRDSIFEFMEFDEIVDNMIVRKNGTQYIMILQCNGVNYDLMSEDEKISVEEGFVQFLNTLRFPIQLYIQSRTLNLRDIIDEYKSRVDNLTIEIDKLDAKIAQAQMAGNKALKELSLSSSNFNTLNVTKMDSMFEGCGQLKSLDLSNFQTQGVYDMSYMFANCSNLESLNLSTFKTDAAENMSYMFWQCRSLALLDLSNCSFKNTLTRNAIDCTLIFDGIGLGFGYGVIESVIYVTTNGKSYLESLQEKYGYTTGLRSNAKLVVKSN